MILSMIIDNFEISKLHTIFQPLLSVEHSPAILRRKYYVIFAIPRRV